MNLEKDSGNLRLLVNLSDEEEGFPWQPFYRGAKGWLAGQPKWPKLLYSVLKVWWLS
jgi:hypothetical protein